MSIADHLPDGGAPHSMYQRADLIMGAFDSEHLSLSVQGLMGRTGLPKTSVYRSIEKMVELRWLEHCHDGRYSLGRRLFEFAGLVNVQAVLRSAALASLEVLYEATHETINLAVLECDQVLYVEKLVGNQGSPSYSRVGGRRPAYCIALGKVLIAYGGDGVWDRMLRRGLAPRTSATIVSPLAMKLALARIRDEGVGFDQGECTVGLACVAAPVMAADGSCVAAVSITGPAHRLSLSRSAPLVREAAWGISRQLSARAPCAAHA